MKEKRARGGLNKDGSPGPRARSRPPEPPALPDLLSAITLERAKRWAQLLASYGLPGDAGPEALAERSATEPLTEQRAGCLLLFAVWQLAGVRVEQELADWKGSVVEAAARIEAIASEVYADAPPRLASQILGAERAAAFTAAFTTAATAERATFTTAAAAQRARVDRSTLTKWARRGLLLPEGRRGQGAAMRWPEREVLLAQIAGLLRASRYSPRRTAAIIAMLREQEPPLLSTGGRERFLVLAEGGEFACVAGAEEAQRLQQERNAVLIGSARRSEPLCENNLRTKRNFFRHWVNPKNEPPR